MNILDLYSTPRFKKFVTWWERRYHYVDDGGWPTRGETVTEC